MTSNVPTEMEELEATRQKLLKDIKEAEKLFATDPRDVCTMNTVKSGLKYIEEMIEDLRTR
jgi:hypothetical protein